MKPHELIELIEQNKFKEFNTELRANIKGYTEKQRQKLLVDIMDCYYHRDMFLEYLQTFDIIIGKKLNLNFNIDHWAPTFLSLVTLRAPHKDIFDYFIGKGADINFVGDSCAFDKIKEVCILPRYLTCLDFIEFTFYDFFLTFGYDIPKKKIEGHWTKYNNEDTITLTKSEYLHLHEQSKFLFDLIHTDKLTDHIKRCGGKTYNELNKID